jgi:protein-disulfide isomerase
MSTLKAPLTSTDHVLGPSNASVIMVEYGDYECPHWRAAYPVVNMILRQFGSRIRSCRHFPLTLASVGEEHFQHRPSH